MYSTTNFYNRCYTKCVADDKNFRTEFFRIGWRLYSSRNCLFSENDDSDDDTMPPKMMIYPIDLSDKIDLLESLKKTQGNDDDSVLKEKSNRG
ncbi:hypothetical protein RIR_jg11778.t1 [Rhizophagus irregularis DAOM 181602=DAOM 197198]|nr:hypothetical protein RIR_jg11778.t1 [Rhizophagus irregularis DAOM 181602=DAOM 197198]